MIFNSIQEQLQQYARNRQAYQPRVYKNVAQQLPLPNYSFTPIVPSTVKPLSNFPKQPHPISVSPRHAGLPLPVKFENKQSVELPKPVYPLTQKHTLTVSLPQDTFRSISIPKEQNYDKLPVRSRVSQRKHSIFSGKQYSSAVRSNSRRKIFQQPDIIGSQVKEVGLAKHPLHIESRLFNQSIGSNRFYNHTEQKHNPINKNKDRRVCAPSPRSHYSSKQQHHPSSSSHISAQDAGSPRGSVIQSLNQLRAKEGEGRIFKPSPKQIPTASNSKQFIPEARRLDSVDYRGLAADMDPRNRFFDSQKSNFAQRSPPKQHIYFNTEPKPEQLKIIEEPRPDSLEYLLRKLDNQGKLIAILVIAMVISLFIYQIVR